MMGQRVSGGRGGWLRRPLSLCLVARSFRLLAGAVFAAPVSGTSAPGAQVGEVLSALEQLAVKGRAPKTGYARSEFGVAWTDTNTVMWGGNSLSTREDILSRDLVDITCKDRSGVAAPPCVVQSGVLHDPYTGTTVNFVRGGDDFAARPDRACCRSW